MGYKSKYKGSEIDSLLDKAKNDYTVKQYTDYAGYNADTSRPSNTISLIQQDQSVVVGGKRYSQNAECYVGSNTSGISTTGNWFLCGEATITNARDVNIMGIVQQTVASGACGIFVLGLRGYSESASKFNFSWICKTSGAVPLLRVVINGHTVMLYCKVYGGQYQYAHIRLLNQCNQYESKSYKTSFFTLKDSTTIIPESDVPSGTDIADVPYLTKSGDTVIGTMTFKEWVYNDKSVRNKQGEYAHIAYKTRGTAGYVKVATITINQTHADEPICFEIMQRKQPLAKLRLQYSTAGNTNPPLNAFTYQGTSVNYYYLHQTGSGVWDLYVRKDDSWTAITVSKVSIGGYSNGYYQNPNFTITWQDELVTAVPEGSVAATKATEYVNISGNADSANKLATSRSFKLGGGLNGTAVKFDGASDVELKGGLMKVTSSNGNKYNYQYHRFLSIGSAKTPLPATAQNYHFTFLVQSTETAEYEGILDINLRTNGSTQNNYLDCKWLLLSSNYSNYHPKIAYGHSNGAKTSYVDFFIVHREAYKAYHFVLLSFNLRGMNVISDTHYTLYNSYEPDNTTSTDKLTSSEVYASIAQAGQEIHGHTTDAGYSIVKDDTVASNVATFVNGFVKTANTAVRSTDSAFLQSLEGLCHKSQDSSLNLRRRTEYICGHQVLSDSEEAGKAFYGSSANPLVISVPLKDPGDAVAGGKVNVNLIRYYYAENYWQELFFCVNSPNIYTRWVTNGKARPWYRMMKEDSTIEYNAWVAKATTATNADVANKTKYPIVFKRNGASITNWFADTTFTIDIPEELLDYSAPTGIALKVPEIDVAKEAKKVANKLSLTVNGSTTEYDGSAGARVSIKANCTHIVKANSNSSLGILYPEQTGHPSAVTVPVSILPLEPYNSAARGLNDGDTLILHIPNSMSNPTANYVWCVKLDITKENATDNIIPLIHGQSAGTPAFWNTSTTIPAGFYQFVYSATLGGLVYMYSNTSTT